MLAPHWFELRQYHAFVDRAKEYAKTPRPVNGTHAICNTNMVDAFCYRKAERQCGATQETENDRLLQRDGRGLFGTTPSLARIIHERFCYKRGYAAATAVSPLSPSTYCMSMPQGFTPPSARLASRLHAFATNRHE